MKLFFAAPASFFSAALVSQVMFTATVAVAKGITPNDAAIVRLVCAMMLEQNDERSWKRRHIWLEGLQALCDTAAVRLSDVAR